MEIEKKYLLKDEPEGGLNAYPFAEIEQSYISRDPVIRLRYKRTFPEGKAAYILTIKGGGLSVREEHELPLSREAYERLLRKTEGGILKKRRYLVPLAGGLTAEVDVFENPEFQGLRLVEVEFASEEAMKAFVAPVWFGQDVSGTSEYHNSTLVGRLKG